MLTTRLVNITEHVDAIWPLLEAHRRELATHLDLMPLGPQVDVYKHLEKQGKLLSVVLMHEGEIVGYSVNILTFNMHYSTLKICQNDVIYVAKNYRAEGGGRQLIDATETNARNAECRMVAWHAKQGTQLEKILTDHDYSVQDIVFTRILG